MNISALYLTPILLFFSLFTATAVMGQDDFEAFKKNAQAQFNTYKQTENKKFNLYRDSLRREYKQFRDSVNSELNRLRDSMNLEFGKHLKQSWQKKEIRPSLKPDLLEQAPFYHSINTTNRILAQQLDNSPKNTFYGKELDFTIPKGVIFKLKKTSEADVSEAWLHLNKSNLTELICDCLLVAQDMNLNTWGYFQMISWLSDCIFPAHDRNEKIIFRFFLLSQSGYKCKIAADKNGTLCLLLPFNAKIYQKNYLEYEDLLYYIMEDNSDEDSELSAYPQTFAGAKKIPDIYLHKPLKLDNPDYIYKEFKLPTLKKTLKVAINKQLIQFYNDYLFCQLDVYANAAISDELRQAVQTQLSPLLKDLTENQQINYLLNFTHTAFQYKPDQEYWKKERYFFPEECLFYPYMDCEDFAILFRNLVNTATTKHAILVLYKDHVSTAVGLSQEITTGYVQFRNKKYTLCDPSYIGSHPGQVMPQVSQIKYRIME